MGYGLLLTQVFTDCVVTSAVNPPSDTTAPIADMMYFAGSAITFPGPLRLPLFPSSVALN